MSLFGTNDDLLNVLSTVFGALQAGAIFLIAWQIWTQARATRAQLLHELDKQFVTMLPDYWELRSKPDIATNEDGIQKIYVFFSFFEKCYMLMATGTIRHSDFIAMFGKRFHTIMTNPAVEAYINYNREKLNFHVIHKMRGELLPEIVRKLGVGNSREQGLVEKGQENGPGSANCTADEKEK
jgi:hypothetical protein